MCLNRPDHLPTGLGLSSQGPGPQVSARGAGLQGRGPQGSARGAGLAESEPLGWSLWGGACHRPPRAQTLPCLGGCAGRTQALERRQSLLPGPCRSRVSRLFLKAVSICTHTGLEGKTCNFVWLVARLSFPTRLAVSSR